MIKVNVERDQSGEVRCVSVSGHAGFAKRGKDIVCAAVSMLVTNCVNSLDKLTECPFSYEENEKDALMCITFKEGMDERAKLLTDSLLLGLKSVEDCYGHGYISIIDRR